MNDVSPISYAQLEYSDAVKATLKRKPQLFIGVEWVELSHDKTIEVEDPSSGKTVSHIANASDKDVDRAVAAARAAFDNGCWKAGTVWRNTPRYPRSCASLWWLQGKRDRPRTWPLGRGSLSQNQDGDDQAVTAPSNGGRGLPPLLAFSSDLQPASRRAS